MRRPWSVVELKQVGDEGHWIVLVLGTSPTLFVVRVGSSDARLRSRAVTTDSHGDKSRRCRGSIRIEGSQEGVALKCRDRELRGMKTRDIEKTKIDSRYLISKSDLSVIKGTGSFDDLGQRMIRTHRSLTRTQKEDKQ